MRPPRVREGPNSGVRELDPERRPFPGYRCEVHGIVGRVDRRRRIALDRGDPVEHEIDRLEILFRLGLGLRLLLEHPTAYR
jgi:hypothetical protein